MFADALKFTLSWEGGYANVKGDKGGQTYMGITQKTCDAWTSATKQARRSCRSLSDAEIEQIYRVLYWDTCKCDSLKWPLAAVVFDCSVHSGPERSIKILQQACKVADDGIIGPITLGTSATVDPLRVIQFRRDFLNWIIKNDPSQEKFRMGWMNRLLGLERLTHRGTF